MNSRGNLLFYVVATLTLLAATMDHPAISVGGATLRVSWFCVIPLAVFIWSELKGERNVLIFCIVFLGASLPSLMHSVALGKSFFYLAWVLFDYFIFFSIFYTASTRLAGDIFHPIFWISRFHIIVGLLLFILRIQDRPASFLYEPSNLSIVLIPYVVALLFRTRFARWYDYALLLLFVVTSQSATLLLFFGAVLVLSWAQRSFQRRGLIRAVIRFSALVVIGVSAFLAYVYNVDDLNTTVIRKLIDNVSGDSLFALLMRGGNRYPRMVAALNVGLDNWLFGTGLGAYDEFAARNTISSPEFFEPLLLAEGQPAVNIWLEVFATVGVLGLVCFVAFSIYVFLVAVRSDNRIRWILSSIMISMFLVMSFESNFVRAYLWCYLGLVLGLARRFSAKSSTGSGPCLVSPALRSRTVGN